MKSNPFYIASALAMLLGCWLLSEAMHLQAGQLGGLVLLMAVLQVYEGLLVALGSFLVRTQRAPRDGLVVLVLETVFLMDATLLASECVTSDTWIGTAVAVVMAALAWAKLAWVRRSAPELLSKRAAVVLGAHAVAILGLPVAAAHLANARVLGPTVLYGFWWITLAAPLLQRLLRREARLDDSASGGAAAWTWTPCGLLLLHLWTVGYTHTIDFQPAFVAPLLLGLAVTSAPGQILRQLMLPAVALLLSLGQGPALGFHFAGEAGTFVSPARLAALGAALAWGFLVWRDRDPRLMAFALGAFPLGALGPATSVQLMRATLRWLESAAPRDGFGWGMLTVIAAFVLLAAGARRSLEGEPRWPRRGLASRGELGDGAKQAPGRAAAAKPVG